VARFARASTQRLEVLAQHSLGHFPAETSVRDAYAVAELGKFRRDGLIAFEEIAFDHHADERRSAGQALSDEVFPDFLLAGMLLAGIGVAAIDHEHGRERGFFE
jgi:hypothetical protein